MGQTYQSWESSASLLDPAAFARLQDENAAPMVADMRARVAWAVPPKERQPKGRGT